MDIMTPSYLFSVISMFLMGYNTRYLAITKIVRNRFNGNNCNLESRELEILKTFRKRLDYIKASNICYFVYACFNNSYFLQFIQLERR